MGPNHIYDIDSTDEALVKRRLIGLVMGCPTDAFFDTCPFTDIRHNSLEERVSLIDALNHEQRVSLYHHHRTCLCNQE